MLLTFYRFKAKVFFWLPKLHGIYKTQCLEIIRRRVDHFQDAFKELKSKGFEDMLSHRFVSCNKELEAEAWQNYKFLDGTLRTGECPCKLCLLMSCEYVSK